MNLHLLELGDSALRIGGYSHSWGLEAAIDRGLVRDAIGLESWVRSWLPQVVGPLEGAVVAGVCRAVRKKDWSPMRQANDLLQASLTPNTVRSASREMGQQLLALAEAWPWASPSDELRVMSDESTVMAGHSSLITHDSSLTPAPQCHHPSVLPPLPPQPP